VTTNQMRILTAAYDRGAATAEIARAIELAKSGRVTIVVLLNARGMTVQAKEVRRG
jgi:hypothetical protein